MDRRSFLTASLGLGLPVLFSACRGKQLAHVLRPGEKNMVGSHTAGSETWGPLINDSVGKLLGRHATEVVQVSGTHEVPPLPGKRRICFVGVENASSEEIGDFREQIYELIDSCISQSQTYAPFSRRFVDAGLRQTRLAPSDLFLPANRSQFAATLEQMDAPFDYLLFAKITSGTTNSNGSDYQRDYSLTLEMVDVRTGHFDKESATLRKGYHRSVLGKIKHYAG